MIAGFGVALMAMPFLGQAVQMLQAFGTAAINAAIAADKMRTSLEYSTGSKGGAKSAYAYADFQANKLGIDRNATIEGYAKLRASSKGKISEEQANTLFEGVGSAATTLGLTADEQGGVFLALGQMMSKGSVQAEELRGQVGERLPGAFAIAARSMGVTEAQLGKMMETGSVAADQFLPRFGEQMKREFGGSAQEASQNLQSSLFRMNGSLARLSETLGSTAAPAVKFFVDTASGGLAIVEQHGAKFQAVFSVMTVSGLLSMGATALKVVGPMITSFMAYNGIAATIPGVLGAIGSSLMSLLPIVGAFAAKFFIINGAIEITKTLFSAFTPSDLGAQFESQAEKIRNSLKSMEEQGKKTKDAISVGAPSKGIDFNAMTLGLSGAIGMNKGDDLVKTVNNNGILNAIASLTPIIGWSKNVNEANGGEGFATTQEGRFNDDKIKLTSKLGDATYDLTGKAYSDRGRFIEALKQSKKEQEVIDLKQAEKNRLSTQGGDNKDKIAKIDEEIKAAGTRRDEAAKPFSEYRRSIEQNINDLKAQKDTISKSGDYSDGQKKELTDIINAQLNGLESVKRQLDGMNKQFDGSGDIISKFNVALSDIIRDITNCATTTDCSISNTTSNSIWCFRYPLDNRRLSQPFG
jgi:tape measure domain-containing protein